MDPYAIIVVAIGLAIGAYAAISDDLTNHRSRMSVGVVGVALLALGIVCL